MSSFRILSRLITFAKTAVIARALTPSQFGLFGIASLTLSLLEMLTETGINIIIIQSKRNLEEYISSAWVVSIIRGALLSLIIILAAPFIASFFNTENAKEILLFISLIPFVRGFINPAIVQFQKDLKFKQEFILRSMIFLFDACITIVFVLFTHSPYALVWGMLSGAMLEVFLSFLFIRPLPRFILEKEYFSEIFHKGKWVTMYGIFNYFAQEGDSIAVGRLLGSSSLGTYQMAYKISTLPISEVTDVFGKVVFPVYTKIADDTERLFKAFLKSTAAISVSASVIGLIIFNFPREIILLLLGEQWLSAAQVLQVLALYGVLRAIFGSASTVFLAKGKQQYVTYMTFVRFLGLLITIYPLVLWFGIIGAAYAALFSVLLEIPIIMYYLFNIFRHK